VGGQAKLLAIIGALSALGFLLRGGKGGQQHRRQDSNDGNDHQQFNQRKGAERALFVTGAAVFGCHKVVSHYQSAAGYHGNISGLARN
jgi:hypothetical protein